MAKLSKDQQEFWNILKYPYPRNCQNCKHDVEGCHDIVGLCNMNVPTGANTNRKDRWIWDGKSY